MKEKDIVAEEAFKVVKQDFLASLVHKGKSIPLEIAFGMDHEIDVDPRWMLELYNCNKHSLALRKIMERVKDLNEFTFYVFHYAYMAEKIHEEMKLPVHFIAGKGNPLDILNSLGEPPESMKEEIEKLKKLLSQILRRE